MKAQIHPKYYNDCKVTCACGNTFTVGSTASEIKVEICSKCHPFFTGESKFVDTEGRIERFERKRAAAAARSTSKITSGKMRQKKAGQKSKK